MLTLTIVLMALVTVIPRILPVAFLAEKRFPPAFERWLRFVPMAILSAMLAVEVLWRDGKIEPGFGANPHVPATLVATLVATLTRSLFATVFAGMAVLALMRAWG